MDVLRSTLRVLSWTGAFLALSGCDQISQRLSSPASRQPATPMQPVTIQPVPSAAPTEPPPSAATPAPAPQATKQPSQEAAGTNSNAVQASPQAPRPDQETLSTAKLRQSSPLAPAPGGTAPDRNQGR
ncbi:hypothetical protein MCEMIE11_01191 [Burkholderiales bacterium]